MQIEEIDINLIQPYENNPRNNENSVNKVAKSIKEFGFEFDFDLNSNEQVEDDDFEVELPKEAKTKLGDIYQLGRYKLMCGDSTDINAVEKLLNGVTVDLFLTDPPYNVDYEGDTADHLKIENDSMSDENFLMFLTNAFNCAAKFMKEGACFYIWYSSSQTLNFWQACANAKLDIKQNLIWAKSHFVISRHDYHYKHEPCFYGWKPGAKHNWYNDRKQTTILEFDKPLRNAEHPTMKPVELFNYQICNNTTKDDVVLDLFGGSGTTLIACEQNGRSSYLMELDPKYCDVIVERWEKLTNQKAKLIRNGTV